MVKFGILSLFAFAVAFSSVCGERPRSVGLRRK